MATQGNNPERTGNIGYTRELATCTQDNIENWQHRVHKTMKT